MLSMDIVERQLILAAAELIQNNLQYTVIMTSLVLVVSCEVLHNYRVGDMTWDWINDNMLRI